MGHKWCQFGSPSATSEIAEMIPAAAPLAVGSLTGPRCSATVAVTPWHLQCLGMPQANEEHTSLEPKWLRMGWLLT